MTDKHEVLGHQSTKRFGPISVAHRQWRHDGHCRFVHGYGRHVEIKFGCSELDAKGWCVDFGSLKDIRLWLEGQWDHRLLIAEDDPLLPAWKQLHQTGGVDLNIMPPGFGPGIEDSARYILMYVSPIIEERTKGRCWVESVRVWEHENNSAICFRTGIMAHEVEGDEGG